MEQKPRVSVIIATYNWSSVLRYAIESVLWQTLTDFELLVVGDGCTDDSEEVVAAFLDPRVRWHNLPENSGHQSAPNNFGLRRARGDFIAYLGHDDLWHPTHLAGLVRGMEESGAAIAYSWMEMIWPAATGIRVITGISPTGETDPRLVLPPSSVMHRRALIDEVGGWKDYRSISPAPDTEFLLRAHEHGKKFVQVKQLTAFKFNAAARPGCYSERPSHEQAEYVARMKTEPDFIVRELCAYAEAKARQHPEHILWANASPALAPGAHIREARIIRGLESRAIPEPSFPPLPNERINFGASEAERFLWYGWSYSEGDFRWSDGEKAAIAFRSENAASLQLKMAVAPFLVREKIPEQVVDLCFNGQQLPPLRLVQPEMKICVFDLPQSALKEENVLEFSLPTATVPSNVGLSGDVRKLALRVGWMEFSITR